MKTTTLLWTPAVAEATGGSPATAPAAGNLSVEALAKRLNTSSPATNGKATPEKQSTGKPADQPQETSAETETEEPATTEATAATEETTENPETAEAAAEDTAEPTETEEATDTTEPSSRTEAVQAALDAVKEFGGDPSKINKKLLGRIHDVVDQRDTERNARLAAEEQVRELSGRLEQAGKPGGAPALNPAPFHPEVAKLDQQIAASQQVLNWAEATLDDAQAQGVNEVEVSDGKGGTVKYTLAQVRQFKASANSNLTQLNARKETRVARLQEEHVTQVKAAQKEANTRYAWTKNEKSPEFQEAVSILREVPEITLRATWPLDVADMVAGRMARLNGSKTVKPAEALGKPLAGKPKGGTKPPPVVTAPGAAAPRVEAGQKEVQEAEKRFKQTGRVADYEKLVAARGRARQAARTKN